MLFHSLHPDNGISFVFFQTISYYCCLWIISFIQLIFRLPILCHTAGPSAVVNLLLLCWVFVYICVALVLLLFPVWAQRGSQHLCLTAWLINRNRVPEMWKNNRKSSSLLTSNCQSDCHRPFPSSLLSTRRCALCQGEVPILRGYCCWSEMKLDATLSAVPLQERCLCVWKQTSTPRGSSSGVSPVDPVLSRAEYLICGGNKYLLGSQKMSRVWKLEKPPETCTWRKSHVNQREPFHLFQ